MIIIPDVHGRRFWKEAIKEKQKDEKIIFLGDYLDPYNYEFDPVTQTYITKESAFENFKEIIEYAKDNPDDVILLLGNHDTEYFLNTPDCRMDNIHQWEIYNYFLLNIEMFKLGYYLAEPGSKIVYTFSHSCLTKDWVEFNSSYFGEITTPIEVIDRLNESLKNNLDVISSLSPILSQIGAARWGDYMFGSIIWADVSEFNLQTSGWGTGFHQIFGHTQQVQYPIYNENFSMLDCRRAFRLFPETGEIKVLLSDIEREAMGSDEENYNRHGREEI